MMACAVPATGDAFLSGLLAHIDCQAQVIGATGYQALANPTSAVSLVLTGLLTLFIAIYGLRMLTGHAPAFGDIMVATLKVGMVLMLATSWAAYRVIAYDTVLTAPAELLEDIGSPSGLPGVQGGLTARLQAVDDAIVAFTLAGSGRFDLSAVPLTQNLPGSARTPMSDDLAFGIARTTYLGATIASLGLVRLVAGLLLALAPLFAGLLLFETTHSFFMGWIRLLVGTALGALAVTMVLAIELAILEPWLTNVLTLRAARIATPSAPLELLVLTLAFGIILFGVIALGVRLAFTTSFPSWRQSRGSKPVMDRTGLPAASGRVPSIVSKAEPDVSRAFVVAEAVSVARSRETMNGGNGRMSAMGASVASAMREGRDAPIIPIGQSHGRTLRRVSSSAVQRSQRT